MPHQKVRFSNDDGQALAGLLDAPAGRPRAYAVFAHCFTCSKNLKASAHITRALVNAGIAVLRFDFTGLGESEGEFADTSFSGNVADLVAAARFLEKEYDAPALLFGHSLGGTAMLLAARHIPSAVAVATIGSPAHPSHVKNQFTGVLDEIAARGEARVTLGGRSFTLRRRFLQDLDNQPLPSAVAHLRKALLILHSPLDATVSIDDAGKLFEGAKHPKSFISLHRADHLLSNEEDSRYVGDVLAAWAGRYLASTRDAPVSLHESGEVAAETREGFLTRINAAGHRLVTDEPVAYGGGNAGPSPYDLLAAALASCTSMTLRTYADKKELPLERVTVRVHHAKIHAADCEECETRDGRIDEFQRSVELEGELSPEARDRLLAIADKCPVHRTLSRESRITTRLAGEPAATRQGDPL